MVLNEKGLTMETEAKHEPVMMEEVLTALRLRSGQVAVDGTLGLAGHASRIAEAIAPEGTLVGFDWDASMLEIASGRLREKSGIRFIPVHADYRAMLDSLEELGLKADGILMDLGLNSAQIEDPTRGIAFRHDGPLDMRMDRSAGEPASALLNRLGPDEIEKILWTYGDERWARAIAKAIVQRRKDRPLRTTADLVDVVNAAVPAGARDKRIHPATRTFQAVRIAVNRELEGLEEAVTDAAQCLAPGGTLVVLSYHSGEDRAVKHAFRALAGDEFEEPLRKPQEPTAEEVARNPRSRSAKLRLLRRTSV